ncbi:hypothetical protein CISIN_1g041504mg [Citrus sinensis]|uniref:Uncharacterized protein n=1 Tax=Citrus sinensis TaxID=2711 RepID=A0A067EJX4_CITSI|nr:hypothetical protein CISIN_1g041504mg [Citrus sinensis]
MGALVTGGAKGIRFYIQHEAEAINNVETHVSRPRTVDFSAEDFLVLMATNFESAFHLSRLGQPLLKISGSSVVMMSSAAGVVPVIIRFFNHRTILFNSRVDMGSIINGLFAGAMNQLVGNLACESEKDNIRDNSVLHWIVTTPLSENSKEVDALVAFLCIPAASDITGQTICIDGGLIYSEWLLLTRDMTDKQLLKNLNDQ